MKSLFAKDLTQRHRGTEDKKISHRGTSTKRNLAQRHRGTEDKKISHRGTSTKKILSQRHRGTDTNTETSHRGTKAQGREERKKVPGTIKKISHRGTEAQGREERREKREERYFFTFFFLPCSFFSPCPRASVRGFFSNLPCPRVPVRGFFNSPPCLRARFLLVFSFFIFLSSFVSAQTRTDAPYLIPQIIFVGDPGRLVVPIGRAFARVEPFVWDNPDKLIDTTDLVIQRIELERRGGVSRVLIDFIPYAPGTLSLPPLEFPSQDVSLLGLEVQVASILDPSQMVLTEPAAPLAVPGTSLLVYGTLVFVLFLLAMGIAASFWGRRHFRDFLERLRRKYLLRNMMRFLRRLNQECRFEANSSGKKPYLPAFYLTRLSTEFREFLTQFTGINCRSLTAGEFLLSPSSFLLPAPYSLCNLFRSWDILRFSGRGMEMADLFVAMLETEKLISVLGNESISPENPLTERVAEGQ